MTHTQTELTHLKNLDVFESYEASPYLSLKHSSYFQVYEELLSKYKNQKITFVEIGVLNGGSLFMWRDFLGPEVRIIGIDLNPLAKKWEKDGFEIYIGSQSDEKFWDHFFATVGDVDVILDDGGHTNEQQIITANRCIPHIKNSGLLIVEDTHASYMKPFGNPSKYSFINYSKRLMDSINARSPLVSAFKHSLADFIYSITLYESIVCFKIDRSKCFIASTTSNHGLSVSAEDFRHQGSLFGQFVKWQQNLSSKLQRLKKIPPIKFAVNLFFSALYSLNSYIKSRKMRKYFS